MKTSVHDLLLRSLDTNLTADEQRRLDSALAESEDLRLEAEQIDLLRRTVADSVPGTFRPFFAERVLARMRSEEMARGAVSFVDALFATFRPLAFAAVVILVVLLSFNAVRNDGAVMAGVLPDESVSVEVAFDPATDWIGE